MLNISLVSAHDTDLLPERFIATEKIDGTKLTLVKSDGKHIVAYKNSIIDFGYFSAFRDLKEKIILESNGFLQYSLIEHDVKYRSKNVNEVLTEFSQKKPTVLSDYTAPSRYLYAVACAESLLMIREFSVFTVPLRVFGVSSAELSGVVHTSGVRELPKITVSGTTFGEAARSLGKSTLGGKPEGIVITDTSSGITRKLVRQDQYSSSSRRTKKLLSIYDEANESVYWSALTKLAVEIATSSLSASDASRITVQRVHELAHVTHFPRNTLRVTEDLLLTVKLARETMTTHGASGTVGIICGSFKPIHAGHFDLIVRAKNECASVVVIGSTASREQITHESIFRAWRDFILPHIDPVDFALVDNPWCTLRNKISSILAHTNCNIRIYTSRGDEHKFAKFVSERVQLIIVDRFAGGLSGTQLRSALRSGTCHQKFLPAVLRNDQREAYVSLFSSQA